MFSKLLFIYYKEMMSFVPYLWTSRPLQNNQTDDKNWADDRNWDLIAEMYDGKHQPEEMA